MCCFTSIISCNWGFKREYARQATPPCRLPHVFTLSGFIDKNSETVVADEMEVLATFYALELESEGGKEGFDRFLNPGARSAKGFSCNRLSFVKSRASIQKP